jgi:hypothetical protein
MSFKSIPHIKTASYAAWIFIFLSFIVPQDSIFRTPVIILAIPSMVLILILALEDLEKPKGDKK